jgi:hypothetical protein
VSLLTRWVAPTDSHRAGVAVRRRRGAVLTFPQLGGGRRGPCEREARKRDYFELCGRNRKPPQNW